MNIKEVIENRRAYRSLESIEITKDLIVELVHVAQIAPSYSNNQPWRFIFIKDQNVLNTIFTTLSKTNKWVEKASLIIAVFSKPENDCIIGDRKYNLIDMGLATAFIILRATELGLVAHPIAGFNEQKAKKILHIPLDMNLITLIIIGKHSKESNPVLSEKMKLGEKQRPPRKPLNEFIFIDDFRSRIEL